MFHRLKDFRLFRENPTFENPRWEDSDLRVLVLRLSPFTDVQRSTPHLFLAGEVRRAAPGAYIDMAFLPEREDARALREAGLPLLLGTQSRRPGRDFDFLLVSNSYLLELVNLPFLFLRSDIPLWSRQRDDGWPLVILGGSNATAAQAIVTGDGDCMADAIFFGEGEGLVGRMVVELHRLSALPKGERLAQAAREVDGLWPAGDAAGSPSREIRKARRDAALAPGEKLCQPVLPGPEATTARLAITLGCPCLCSFCYEGHDRRPYREIPAEAVIEAARQIKRDTGAATLEIESFNFNTHAELAKLLITLNRLFHRVNLMSQRVDILARTAGLVDLEIAADKASFTLGIEGISGRQRRFLHKSLPDADILRALEALHGRKVRELKLFYILTGKETEADFSDLAGFATWLKEMRRAAQTQPRIIFSFGRLVRMPFTPLRWDAPVLSEAAWRPLIGKAKSICETNGFEFRLSHPWPDYVATQALAIGGSSLHELLVTVARRGCVSRDGLPQGAFPDVQDWVLAKEGAFPQEKPKDHGFSFSFLETEPGRNASYRQYLAAKAGRDSGYEASPAGATRSGIPSETVKALAELTQGKRKLSPLFLRVVFPRETAGLGSEWKESWLMRRLLSLCPRQIDNALSVREALHGESGILGADVSWFGLSVVAITAWDPAALRDAIQGAASVPSAAGLFGEEMPGFHPADHGTLRLLLDLPDSVFPDPANRLAAYLRDYHAPVTLQKKAGAFRLTVPEKTLRKKMILEGKAEGTRMELTAGGKFRLFEFLESFGEAASRNAQAEVLGIE